MTSDEAAALLGLAGHMDSMVAQLRGREHTVLTLRYGLGGGGGGCGGGERQSLDEVGRQLQVCVFAVLIVCVLCVCECVVCGEVRRGRVHEGGMRVFCPEPAAFSSWW